MKEYLAVLLGVCFASGLVRAISPEGSGKKYVEIICALCVISAIATPLIKGIEELVSFDGELEFEYSEHTESYDEIYNSYIISGNASAACDALADGIAEYASAPREGISVSLDYTQGENEISVSRARVYIYPRAIATDPQKIREYIKSTLGTECEIIYKNNVE